MLANPCREDREGIPVQERRYDIAPKFQDCVRPTRRQRKRWPPKVKTGAGDQLVWLLTTESKEETGVAVSVGMLGSHIMSRQIWLTEGEDVFQWDRMHGGTPFYSGRACPTNIMV